MRFSTRWLCDCLTLRRALPARLRCAFTRLWSFGAGASVVKFASRCFAILRSLLPLVGLCTSDGFCPVTRDIISAFFFQDGFEWKWGGECNQVRSLSPRSLINNCHLPFFALIPLDCIRSRSNRISALERGFESFLKSCISSLNFSRCSNSVRHRLPRCWRLCSTLLPYSSCK